MFFLFQISSLGRLNSKLNNMFYIIYYWNRMVPLKLFYFTRNYRNVLGKVHPSSAISKPQENITFPTIIICFVGKTQQMISNFARGDLVRAAVVHRLRGRIDGWTLGTPIESHRKEVIPSKGSMSICNRRELLSRCEKLICCFLFHFSWQALLRAQL